MVFSLQQSGQGRLSPAPPWTQRLGRFEHFVVSCCCGARSQQRFRIVSVSRRFPSPLPRLGHDGG